MLLAVAVFGLLQTALDAIILGTLPDLVAAIINLAFFAAVYGAMALGAWRGLRHHHHYVAARLLKKLSAPDLAAVTDIIRDSVNTRMHEPRAE
jgi:hypothetical protein